MDLQRLASIKARAAQGMKWSILARSVTTGVQVLTTVILARFLAPADFGLFSMALIMVGFMQEFADGGMAPAIIRDADLDEAVLAHLFWLNVAISILLASAAAISASPAARFWAEPRLVPTLQWFAVSFLLAAPGSFFTWLLRRELDFEALWLIEAIGSGI